MAILYSTGPALFYVANGGLNPTNIQFLGTAQRAPRIVERRGFLPAQNDLYGQLLSADTGYQGREAFSFATLTRFNWRVLSLLRSSPVNRALGLTVPGFDTLTDYGALQVTEGLSLGLIIVFPYVSKLVYSSNGMPAGYWFPFTDFEGPDEGTHGTIATEQVVQFHSHRAFFPPSTGGGGNPGFLLYTHSLPSLPPID